jgi:protein-disulfide isomerase
VINTDGAPVRGSPDAPVTIVEYSDFQCPYCARSVTDLKEVLNRYPTQVRWVFKHFPLPFHQDAPLAHKASLAAGEQGKFWEMHDLIFARQTAIKRNNLIQYAKDLGLDEKRFIKDLDNGKYQAQIDREVQEGTRLGVTGTPAFFVNGQLLVGARPVEELAGLIDRELQPPLTSSLPPALPSPQTAVPAGEPVSKSP